ncbi:hypothetical protein AB3S75_018634 [Citrus x aurantiifolia]
MMELKASSSLVVLTALVLLFSSSSVSVNGFDIIKILSNHPNLLAFSDLLSQTKLNEAINKRKTITVLAVDNSSIGGLSDRPVDEIKNILSVHVILDYYDVNKLKKLPKTSSWTTMFQSTGNANDKQGYINCTRLPGEQFVFGSAVKDSPPVAKFVKSVFSQPFNISVLQVSQPIVAPGLGDVILPPPPPPYTPPPAMPPKASRKKSNASAPVAEGDDDEFAPSDSPIEAPIEAPAPEPVEAPAQSPPEPKDEAEAPAPSSASRLYLASGVALAGFTAMAFI